VGTPCEFKLQHPTTARWVIEVAVASVDLDREKAAIFAAAGVPEYWIVLADEARIEVYADPTTSGYSSQRQFAAQDGDLHSAQFPGVALDVAALFAGVA
jgi:Uma2 family endonuclease